MKLFLRKACATIISVFVTAFVVVATSILTGEMFSEEGLRWHNLLIGLVYGAPFVILVGLPFSFFVDKFAKDNVIFSLLMYVGAGAFVGFLFLTDGFRSIYAFSFWNVITLSSMLSAASFYLVEKLVHNVLERQ